MPSKKSLILGLVVLGVVSGIFAIYKITTKKDSYVVVEEEKVELPVNVIPVSERPFVTLTPDSSGRYLALGVDQLKSSEKTLEYELIYDTIEGQQGAFGRINLKTEQQPIKKDLLLGSKSAGGAVTYYPGVSGGSIALTWGETKIMESFNFQSFDPEDPSFTSVDGQFRFIMSAKSLKKDDKVVTMKTSGYPVVFPENKGKVIVGPYTILAPTTPKSVVKVELKLPAGEHVNPTIYELTKGVWTKLKTTSESDFVTATPTSNVFIVVSE